MNELVESPKEVRFQDLIHGLVQRNPTLDKQVAEIYAQALFKVIIEFVEIGSPVRLPNIGLLYTSTLPQRQGRLPSTGQVVSFPEKRVPRFRPSQNLKIK